MNRYNFIQSPGAKPIPIPSNTPKGTVEAGQRWTNSINGSEIVIGERQRNGGWLVRETAKGVMRRIDNGEREISESFILSFYKLT